MARLVLLLELSWASGSFFCIAIADVLTIQAVRGSHAYLPCDIEVPLRADDTGARGEGALTLILWYHGDGYSRSATPIFSVDAIDQPLSKATLTPYAEFINRSYFYVLMRPPALKIEPVFESDAGEYRCRADYKNRPSQNRFIHLNVVGKWADLEAKSSGFSTN